MATAAFFVLGISAWHLRRRDGDEGEKDAFRLSFRIGAGYALAATVAVMVVGHGQAQYMTRIQPMKMAAAEALWQTEDPAAMSLFTWGNEPQRRDVFAVKVPGLLSFLAHNRFSGPVEGIRELQAQYEAVYGPGDYVPPVKWTYWTFRAMVGAGILMLLLAAWAVWGMSRKSFVGPRLLALLLPAMALPYIANTTGWIFTEIGRQPWIVFGMEKTANAVSPTVTALEVGFTLVAFTLLYGVLMVADVYLLRKFARAGLDGPGLEPEPLETAHVLA
jgi:cytochrome d ubiquinol oxidase subunit I